ncbi:MAG: TIGR01212 family radical SAM protein [Oscillospiraceae bacterium]
MENPFELSADNKRYLTYNYYLRRRFGEKVIKISLNGGFSCPNIDGRKGFGGCTYCSPEGSGEFAGNPQDDVATQFEQVKKRLSTKWEGVYIPYFQANTNTYAPLSRLKKLYEAALSQENVVGLSISTRPDCIEDDVADYLAELSKKTYLTVELGLQTIHDETAKKINRCHTYAEFLEGYEKLHSRGINVCVHLIDGLPKETKEMMIETVEKVAKLDIHAVKIHLLHVISGTKLAEEYARGEFSTLELFDYVDIVCDQIERLPKNVIIERVTGDGESESLVAPLWSRKKLVVMNEIDKELLRRKSWQGRLFSGN